MYLFHQRHYPRLTFAVSYKGNIFKEVTNRNDIKSCHSEDLVHFDSVKLSPVPSIQCWDRTITNTNINVLLNIGPGVGGGRKKEVKKQPSLNF